MRQLRVSSKERGPARVALKPIKTVLVGMSPLDRRGDALVSAAGDLAKILSGRLTIVHAVSGDHLVPSLSTDWHQSELLAKWTEVQGKELAARVALSKLSVPLETRLASGPPHRSILDTANEIGADLIVIGATERGRFARLLGGTADRVLREARCPVLVVRGDWKLPIERVLVPVDFSLLSAEALECGLCFLSQLGEPEANTELFYVVSEGQKALSEPFGWNRFEEFVNEELVRFGREATGGVPDGLTHRIAVGAPATEILREADRTRADLVVVGTNGQGGVERALIGSVAKAVATKASCPVLFIPPDVALGASVAEAVLEQTEPRWQPRQEDRSAAENGGSV